MNRTYQLGFIGCGHMGMAIAQGVVEKKLLVPERIAVYDPSEAVQKKAQALGMHLLNSVQEAGSQANMTVLAVRPQTVDEALQQLQKADVHCLLSIAAAITIGHIQSFLPGVPVIRALPNTPLLIGCGSTTLCFSPEVAKADHDASLHMFSALGRAAEIPEDQMEDAIALHSSTPAYFYCFVNAIIKDVTARGMDPQLARELAVETMIGSGRLIQESDQSIEELIDAVCSKGGTTIEAVQVLQEQGLDELVHKASEACIRRAEELKK